MKSLPESEHTREPAIEIVRDALRVLTTRDGIAIPDELIAERSRNAVAAILGEFDLVPKVPWVADVRTGRPNPIVSMVKEYLDVRRQAQAVLVRLDAMAVTDAATMVAALLADPFDRSARMEARTWLTTWMASHADSPSTSTTPVAAVRA